MIRSAWLCGQRCMVAPGESGSRARRWQSGRVTADTPGAAPDDARGFRDSGGPRDAGRAVALLAWPLGVLAGSVALGVVVGAVAGAVAQPAFGDIDEASVIDTDQSVASWVVAELVAGLPIGLLVGVVLGVAVATAAWIAGLIFAAQRLFPEGRRGTPVVLTVAAGWLGLLVAAQVARAGPGWGNGVALAPPDVVPVQGLAVGLAVTVAVLALAGLVFPAWDRWGPTAPDRDEPRTGAELDWLPDKGA